MDPRGDAHPPKCGSCHRSFPLHELALFGESRVCADCQPAFVQRLRQGMSPAVAQNTAAALVTAGVGIRLLANTIDGIILLAASYLMNSALQIADIPNPVLLHFPQNRTVSWGFLLMKVLYEGSFLSILGATVGKMVMRTKVVQPDGRPISPGRAFARSALRLADLWIVQMGNVMGLFDSQRRTLWDRICGTRVIRRQ